MGRGFQKCAITKKNGNCVVLFFIWAIYIYIYGNILSAYAFSHHYTNAKIIYHMHLIGTMIIVIGNRKSEVRTTQTHQINSSPYMLMIVYRFADLTFVSKAHALACNPAHSPFRSEGELRLCYIYVSVQTFQSEANFYRISVFCGKYRFYIYVAVVCGCTDGKGTEINYCLNGIRLQE